MVSVLTRPPISNKLVLWLFMLYRSDTWIMTQHIGRFLGRFHHRVDRKLMGRQYRRVQDVVWVYPSLYDALEEAGLQEMET